MKRFNVTVNGVSYDVTVEEIAEDSAPTKSASPIKKVSPKSAVSDGTPVKAPMPGNIMKINVKVGDKVKSGDVLAVLEAMKMENDICAPSDGVVTSVNVSTGAAVKTDEVLLSLK